MRNLLLIGVLILSSCTKEAEEDVCECVVTEVVSHKAAVSCLDGYHIIYNELNYSEGDCAKLN